MSLCADDQAAVNALREKFQHIGDTLADDVARQIAKQCPRCTPQEES
jgi:hypothetical protein